MVVELLLNYFPLTSVFGLENLNQFADLTKTGSAVENDMFQLTRCDNGDAKPMKVI